MASAVEPTVLFRVVNRVAVVMLNRPAALNALSNAMMLELTALIERCRTNSEIVLVVLKGAGEKGSRAGGEVREVHHLAFRALPPFGPLIMQHLDPRSRVDKMLASVRQDLDRGASREVRQWLQSAWDSLTGYF